MGGVRIGVGVGARVKVGVGAWVGGWGGEGGGGGGECAEGGTSILLRGTESLEQTRRTGVFTSINYCRRHVEFHTNSEQNVTKKRAGRSKGDNTSIGD